MKGAIEKANELLKENTNAWMPQQFNNPANVAIHHQTTAQEILNDFPDGVDYLITGVGTGGHITGVAEVLKKHWPQLQVFAVEPELSPVLSGGNPGPHPLQGLGAGFIPAILKTELLNGVIKVSKEGAFHFTQMLARKEGILAGISTGASLAAIAQIISDIPENKLILTFNYDTGERYLSVESLF
jgi:cysteine synthase A